MNGWAIFLGLVLAYAGFYWAVGIRKVVPNFEPVGPLLLWKTQVGTRAIERLAVFRRTWGFLGDLGIFATVAMAVLMMLMLVLQLVVFASDPVRVSENAPPAITLLGLPGVNPMIPLWYGLAGLVVALVIHEGAHGVLARVSDMRVKSTGLLLCVVPVGAFVEPDERDMERASLRSRNRVFAAGPWSNLVVAVLAGVVFSSVFAGAMVSPDESAVTVTQVVPGTPAEAAALQAGDRLLAVTFAANGTENETVAFADATHFSETMNRTAANQTVTFTVERGGETFAAEVTLADRHAVAVERGAEPPEWMRGKGFLGVTTLDARGLAAIRDALADPFEVGPGTFLVYPLQVFYTRVDVLNEPYSDYFQIGGPLAGMDRTAFFALANLFYWIFFINLMLGTFNALPLAFLDGGQMFRASLREAIWRRLGVDRSRVALEPGPGDRGLTARGLDDETQRKLDRAQDMLRRVTVSLGLFILAMILLPILGPTFVNLFAG